MERIRSVAHSTRDGFHATVEWRSALSAPYLILSNAIFWWLSFEGTLFAQQSFLAAIVGLLFSWDVLLTPSGGGSAPLLHAVSWPWRRSLRSASAALALRALAALQAQDLRLACWTAYGSMCVLQVEPVWRAHDVNGKLARGAKQTGVLVVTPFVRIGHGAAYVFCGRWIPPLIAFVSTALSNGRRGVSDAACSVRRAFRTRIIDPIVAFYRWLVDWTRYILLAGWWPGLKSWLRHRLVEPLERAFNYVCFAVLYVVTCKWLPPLLRCLGQLAKRFALALHRTVLLPLRALTARLLRALADLARRALHKAALALRDSVLWPLILAVADLASKAWMAFHAAYVAPVERWLAVRYRKVETVVLVHVLGPACSTLLANIPEKSPFCDDSDVEFEGWIPDDQDEEDGGGGNWDDQEEVEQEASRTREERRRGLPPPSTAAAELIQESDEDEVDGGNEAIDIRLPSRPISMVLTDDAEEDDDFTAGLSFPAIEASESSDDEFDLARRGGGDGGNGRARQRRRRTSAQNT